MQHLKSRHRPKHIEAVIFSLEIRLKQRDFTFLALVRLTFRGKQDEPTNLNALRHAMPKTKSNFVRVAAKETQRPTIYYILYYTIYIREHNAARRDNKT